MDSGIQTFNRLSSIGSTGAEHFQLYQNLTNQTCLELLTLLVKFVNPYLIRIDESEM